MKWLTDLASAPLRAVNRLRRSLYRRGILRSRRLSRPVISIGNIAAGGAGKTPAIIAVAQHLAQQGLSVAVLTRGHGRQGEGGEVISADPDRYGDEPVLIKKRTPTATVLVGSNRYDLGNTIKTDVYLLDDGFQHLQLHRDLDIVIDVGKARLWREGRSALKDADIVIPRAVRASNLDDLRGRAVYAFAGLADNDQFFRMLRDEGLRVEATASYPDHHRYSPEDLRRIRAEAGGRPIVTTEKDAVKIEDAHDIIAVVIEFDVPGEVLRRITSVARG